MTGINIDLGGLSNEDVRELMINNKNNKTKTFKNISSYLGIKDIEEFTSVILEDTTIDYLTKYKLLSEYGESARDIAMLYNRVIGATFEGDLYRSKVNNPVNFCTISTDFSLLDNISTYLVWSIKTKGVFPLVRLDDLTELDSGILPKHLKKEGVILDASN